MYIGGVDFTYNKTLSMRSPEEFKEFMHARVDAFFRDTPGAEALVARKIEEQKAFDEEWAGHPGETTECQCIGCRQDKPTGSA